MKCYICPSDSEHYDDHHIDCCEGKWSPETVPLCRRCHRTYHDLGVGWFDDEYLDKAIDLENRRRAIYGLAPIKREDVSRSAYWNKKHGIKALRGGKVKVVKNGDTRIEVFRLPYGTPLCGWDWVKEHMNDKLPVLVMTISLDGSVVGEFDSNTRRGVVKRAMAEGR